jgi:hypothetical protein
LAGAERFEGGSEREGSTQVTLEEFREEAIEKQEEIGEVVGQEVKEMEPQVAPSDNEGRPYGKPAREGEARQSHSDGTDRVIDDARPQQAEPKAEAAAAQGAEGFRQEALKEMAGYLAEGTQETVSEHGTGPRSSDDGQNEVKIDSLQRLPGEDEPEAEPEAPKTRMLEVVDYGKGAVLRVPKTDLEEAGYEADVGRNAIVQLGLREDEGEDVETVFARYNSSDGRAEAYIGDIGGAKGSRYEVVEAREYDEDRLARDFEKGKCEHLQNVRLEHSDGRMFVNVDERRVELEEHRLSTSGSHVIMRGKLNGEDDCKIEFDGRRASIKFGRDYPVEGMRMEGNNLVVGYSQSKTEKHEHRVMLNHLDARDEKLSPRELERPEVLRFVEVIDAPVGTDGIYSFSVDSRIQESVRRMLEEATKEGPKRYGIVKGEIGERMIPNLLTLCRWEKVERHPFNRTKKEGTVANDTDHVIWDPDHRLSIDESKYWGYVHSAMSRSSVQVAAYYDRNRKYHGMKIERAYAMVMEWSLNDDPIRIHVKRVRPRGDLT